mmetsp:Transcript_18970/g.59026  ORF Transcript_18970/g.59026 Transcript_18970/m.59026 type:complete len:220 (+) Transcript_18970:1556-2215(+)
MAPASVTAVASAIAMRWACSGQARTASPSARRAHMASARWVALAVVTRGGPVRTAACASIPNACRVIGCTAHAWSMARASAINGGRGSIAQYHAGLARMATASSTAAASVGQDGRCKTAPSTSAMTLCARTSQVGLRAGAPITTPALASCSRCGRSIPTTGFSELASLGSGARATRVSHGIRIWSICGFPTGYLRIWMARWPTSARRWHFLGTRAACTT